MDRVAGPLGSRVVLRLVAAPSPRGGDAGAGGADGTGGGSNGAGGGRVPGCEYEVRRRAPARGGGGGGRGKRAAAVAEHGRQGAG